MVIGGEPPITEGPRRRSPCVWCYDDESHRLRRL